jgi:glycosyltransferase involved in cell wall biosynthesis
MIVKNEARIIERCLSSVKDVIDTWCIIDTGSTDGTQSLIKEVLKDIPGKLIERPWVNFGHNRTEAYQYASEMGSWILLIDADQVLSNKGFSINDLNDSVDYYNLEQTSQNLTYQNKRLLNTKKDWKCIGVTHEYWDVKDSHGKKLESLAITDLGDGGSKADKFERDLKLLREGLMEEPQNTRYKFYLAQTHKDLGHFKKAYNWYDVCLNESKWDEEIWYCEYMKAYCLVMSNTPIAEIEAQVMKAWLLRPWRSEPIYMLSKLFKQKNWIKNYYLLKLCKSVNFPKNDVLFIEHHLYGDLITDELSVAAYWANNKQESLTLMEKLLQTKYGQNVKNRILQNIELVKANINNSI